jgi:methylaspartate ammonia-lyase
MTPITMTKVLAVPGRGAFYFDDQAAILAGAVLSDGLLYEGSPVTAGYRRIRQPAESVNVLVILSDGQVAVGDCVSVQYSGVAGRDPLLDAVATAAALTDRVAPALEGQPVRSFREMAESVDALTVGEPHLGAAAGYGVSQALLHAVALAQHRTMAEVIQSEWALSNPMARVPVYAQSGVSRKTNVDKMIARTVDALPHGLINDQALVGPSGEVFIDYVRWVRNRVLALRDSPGYAPTLHFDLYGLLGRTFGAQSDELIAYLLELEDAAAPFAIRIEHPLDAGSRDEQISAMAYVRKSLRARRSRLQIVADEWANTLDDIKAFVAAEAVDMMQIKTPDLGGLQHSVEAILACKEGGVAAHVGGSCTETDIAARASVHLAMACGADQLLAKPGMGVDEGITIVDNEMNRVTALTALTATGGHDAQR